jgi:hypothetical protein
MFTSVEKVFTSVLFVVCAAVGIAGLAFSGGSDPPGKIWLATAGGDVILDHAYHASLAECSDCHHNLDDPDEAVAAQMSCRACHYYGEARDVDCGDPTHARCVGANCVACHQDLGAAMSACNACHLRGGYAFEASRRVATPLPESVEFETDFGTVAFDHALHAGVDLGLGCGDCHHEIAAEEMQSLAREKSCRACHYERADEIPLCELDDMHARCVGANCTNCHGADDCSICHLE